MTAMFQPSTRRLGPALAIGALTLALAGPAAAFGFGRGHCGGPCGPMMGHGPMGGPEFQVERMTRQLGLNEQQQRDLRALLDKEQTEQFQRRQAVRAGIDAILTPEQRARRDAAWQQGLEQRLDRMTAHLDLTAEQRAQVKAVFQEQQANPSLTPQALHERIGALLNEKQRAVFSTRGQGPGGWGGGPGCGMGPGCGGGPGGW